MRVVVIGASGHVGTYLVPRLVALGHEVIALSRGVREPYQPHAAWLSVRQEPVDRDAEDAAGVFGNHVRDLEPDAVIDMICFTLRSAEQMVNALHGHVQHFLHCGTIWVHGPSVEVPAREDQPRRPFGSYGTQKAAIESLLLDRARRTGFPASILHPGHIVGPGWVPVNPAGNFNTAVFNRLARGERVALPNLGMETVHHVHADDVAQAFVAAMANRSAAIGEAFHVVSPAAVTLRGYAETVSGWFGQQPDLEYLPWAEWKETVPDEDAQSTWDHIAHSPNAAIDKARRLLAYAPRYSSMQAVYESLTWLVARGQVEAQPLAL